MRFSRIVVLGAGVVLSVGMAEGQGANDDGENFGPAKCVLNLIEPYMVDASDTSGEAHGTVVVCDMYPEYEDGVEGISYELEGVPDGFYDDVEYGLTSVFTSKAGRDRGVGNGRLGKHGGRLGKHGGRLGKHGGGKLEIKRGAMVKKEKVDKGNNGNGNGNVNNGNGSIRGNDKRALVEGDDERRRRRRLAPLTGTSTLLVLYAKPRDCSNGHTPQEVADDIFGVNGDAVNARSQVKDCSRDKLIYEPACKDAVGKCANATVADTPIVNGVMEVDLGVGIKGMDSINVKNHVKYYANSLLKAIHPDLTEDDFTQVMHIIPDCAFWRGAAWAYVGGKVSAFQSSYSNRMGVQVHEFGHNLGLHHSGKGSASYADHSCLMGNPSFGDDGPQVCFNGAKSWESTWYDEDNLSVDVLAGEQFDGDLIGVADWASENYIQGTHKVVIQIPDPSQSLDYYVMFNRKKGPNIGVGYAADKVTVTTGKYNEVSWHQAALEQSSIPLSPSEYRVVNLNGTGLDLVLKVCAIDTSNVTGTPDAAHVLIFPSGEGQTELMCPGETETPTPAPTTAPTKAPKTAPTKAPTTAPTTAAPTPSAYYIGCGGQHTNCSNKKLAASPITTHEVRCCSDKDLKGGWTKVDSCAVWGASELGNPEDTKGCYHAETYSSAASICTSKGARLCTIDELLNDCTKWTGCNHDFDYVWSSSPVSGGWLS